MKKSLYEKILLYIMCIYPIFSLKIFYNSYFTLVQILIFLILFILGIKVYDLKLKDLKLVITYFLIVLIYFIMHHINTYNFHLNIDYNYINEILSIIKLTMPVIFISIIKRCNYKKEDYIKVIKSWILFISLSILTTNIFKVSYSSYNNEILITGNIFEWSNDSYTYEQLSSVGLFKYANQISLWVISLLPLLIYYYVKKDIKVIYIIILLLSLLLLGTRVGAVGGLLVFVLSIIINLFNKNIDKKRIIILLILLVIYLIILPISPVSKRYKTSTGLSIKYLSNTYIDKIKYIEDNYKSKQINEYFITTSYNYKNDPDFWIDIMNMDIGYRTNYRYLEKRMIKRVVELNNNYLDILFGISNDRVQNIFNIEQNYILEYYAYGITGVVLFLGIYVYVLIKRLLSFTKDRSLFNHIMIFTTSLIIFIPYFSGNILNAINIFIPLLFIINIHNKNKVL